MTRYRTIVQIVDAYRKWKKPETGEYHVPFHNYLGPGTKYAARQKRGDKPTNRFDEIAMEHDGAYNRSRKAKDRRKADRKMIRQTQASSYLNPQLAGMIIAVIAIQIHTNGRFTHDQ